MNFFLVRGGRDRVRLRAVHLRLAINFDSFLHAYLVHLRNPLGALDFVSVIVLIVFAHTYTVSHAELL